MELEPELKSLDLYTLLLMSIFMSAGLSIILFSVHGSLRTEVQGIGHWAGGQLLMLAAIVLMALRGLMPELAAALAYNGALLMAMGVSLIGTQLFFGQRANWRLLLGVCGATLLGLAWWQAGSPSFANRVALYSAAETWIHLSQARLAWRYGERHSSTYFFIALLLLHSVMTVARGGAALLLGDASVDLLGNTVLAKAYLVSATLLIFLLSVVFVVLASRRMQLLLAGRAARDPLTGVLNRRGCAEFYERVLRHGRQSDRPLAVLAIDLDHFKQVNDLHGHATGDQVLIQVAATVRAMLRDCDQVARLGGEEFIALMPGTPAQEAMAVAARLREALRAQAGGLPRCTVSIGVACQRSPDEDFDSLMARADAALYRAKGGGRDRAELAEQGVPAGAAFS